MLGFSVYEVAPATLAATSLTSIAGIATYQVLQLSHGGAVAPEWTLGAGGTAARACKADSPSARCDACSEACLVAARYLQTAIAERPARQAAAHPAPA